jgi:hypothetical protein
MTFLNVILLAGIGAAAVPIVIHFLHRGRSTTVRWAAMHLIEDSLREKNFRLTFERRFLLAVRFLLPAMLALAMARPVLTRNRPLLGHGRKSVAILLDNSYSMEAGGGANSNFAEARNAIARLLQRLDPGSDASVILMAGGEDLGTTNGSQNLAGLAQEVKNLDAVYGRADIPRSLRKAADHFRHAQNKICEAVVFSDFQRVSWPGSERTSRKQAGESLHKASPAAELTLWSAEKQNPENICIDSLELPPMVAGLQQQTRIRANLRNFGAKNWPDLRVFLRVDGQERVAAQISIGPHQVAPVLFSYVFETAGSHLIQVFTEADSLQSDNVLSASVLVLSKIPVLLVNGNPSNVPLEGETDFLEIALQPLANSTSSSDSGNPMECTVIAPEQLNAGLLARARVTVLANVRQLSDAQVQNLKGFVEDGGGCLVFPGDRINMEWYNRVLASPADSFLPASFVAIHGEPDGSGIHIASQKLSHPALQIFNDDRNGRLSEGLFRLWFELRDQSRTNGLVLARLENGNAVLAEHEYGEGRVIQAAVACDADWSNLPTRSFYVPLMQRLVTYLGSTVYPSRNIDAGSPLVAFVPSAEIGKSATVTDSSGRRYDVTPESAGSHGIVQFRQTERPGVYTLAFAGGDTTHFAVNTSRAESDLGSLTESQRKTVAQELGAKLVHSNAEYDRSDYTSRFGHELWQKLIGILLLLSFAELILQQRFAGGRS